MQTSKIIIVSSGRHGSAAFCATALGEGQPVLLLDGPRVPRASKYTIQISEHEHVAPAGADWALINHSCLPNCGIDFNTWQLIALTPIAPGEELRFNYLSTEWDLAAPFDCDCGAAYCPRTIRGYRHLNEDQRNAIDALVSPFLRARISTDLVLA